MSRFSRNLVRTLRLLPLLGIAAFSPVISQAQFSGPALPQTSGVSRTSSITTDPAILFPVDRDLPLGTGDLVTVRVFGPGEYVATSRITIDGTVQLPLIGQVSLKDLSVQQAERFIAQKLIDGGMFRDPQVNLTVVEGPHATVTLIGELHAVLPILGPRRLLDVLAAGGGLPATASHIITINRPGVLQPIVVDLGTDPASSAMANIPIFAGDTIVISRVGVVYVLGSFKAQGAIPIVQNTPLTLLQVAALAGGPLYEGKYDDMRIIRTVGNQRTLVKIDIRKVMYGKAPDPVLQADDVVFLPSSTLKAALKAGGVGTILGLVSVLIALRN